MCVLTDEGNLGYGDILGSGFVVSEIPGWFVPDGFVLPLVSPSIWSDWRERKVYAGKRADREYLCQWLCLSDGSKVECCF